jgi:hypothetical protein
MIFRLFTVGVFVFCGIMTTWLVRSVYFPEYERLPSVDPAHVLDLFLKNEEVTHAFVYRGRVLVGDVMVTSRKYGDSKERAKINERMGHLFIFKKKIQHMRGINAREPFIFGKIHTPHEPSGHDAAKNKHSDSEQAKNHNQFLYSFDILNFNNHNPLRNN